MAQLELFRRRPRVALLTAITVAAVGALSPRPSFIPITILLALMQAYTQMISKGPASLLVHSLLLVAIPALATSVDHVSTAKDALSSATSSVISLFILSSAASFVAMAAILANVFACKHAQVSDTQFILLPAIWVTTWQIIANISPLGWLTTWSPVVGIEAYAWMRPICGSWGIMWVMAAWAQVIGMLVLDTAEEDEETPLITIENTEGQLTAKRVATPTRRRSAIALAAVLIALTVPSYSDRIYPLPSMSPNTIPITVACALPPPVLPGQTTLDTYVTETQKLVKDAKIILWPEGAVRFENMKEREAAIERLQNFAGATHSSYIGMTFEQTIALDHGGQNGRPRTQNGLALVGGKQGVVFEYYKRNLVPIAESFNMISSQDPPTIHELAIHQNRYDKHPHNISLTASICLDFASPNAFSDLPSRPALILAPARTWETDVSMAMWEQVKARTAETGSIALFCDGGNGGVSGVVGQAMSEPTQVGSGSWVRTVAVQWPFDDSRTIYAAAGDWTMLVFVWALCGVAVTVELGATETKRRLNTGGVRGWTWVGGLGQRLRGAVRRDRRPLIDLGEEDPLLG